MTALWCVFRALHAPRRVEAWLAAAGLCFGLAIGSRPTYFFATTALALPLIYWWWCGRAEQEGRWWPVAGWWRRAIAAVAPLAAVGVGLAWYNYARFGSVVEFGVSYELSGVYEGKMRHFSASYVPLNFYRYFLAPPRWTGAFPFLAIEPVTTAPDGYFIGDDMFGLWRERALHLARARGAGGGVAAAGDGPGAVVVGGRGARGVWRGGGIHRVFLPRRWDATCWICRRRWCCLAVSGWRRSRRRRAGGRGDGRGWARGSRAAWRWPARWDLRSCLVFPSTANSSSAIRPRTARWRAGSTSSRNGSANCAATPTDRWHWRCGWRRRRREPRSRCSRAESRRGRTGCWCGTRRRGKFKSVSRTGPTTSN